MKRTMLALGIAMLMAVSGILVLTNDSDESSAYTDGDWDFNVNIDGTTATIYHYRGTSGVTNLTIPSTVTYNTTTYTVTGISGASASEGVIANTSLASNGCLLTLPNTLTTIDDYAFYGCSRLAGTLVIPDSVTTIGNNAFANCSGFTGTLSIPDNVTAIGEGAFTGCTGFTYIDIGDAVTTIGNLAFYQCNFNDILVLPNTLVTIGNLAFSSNQNLHGTLVIPDSVTTIGNNAFGYTGFSGVTFGDSVTAIGEYAFAEVPISGTLTLPDSLLTIGAYAFTGCTGITGNLIIPDSVTNINNSAFAGCTGLNGALTLGDSLTQIGTRAFYMTHISGTLGIPDSITAIGDYAFYNTNLSGSLVFGDTSRLSIGESAFAGCNGLNGTLMLGTHSLSLNIGDSAFAGCSFTGNLTIPSAEYLTLGDNIFNGCDFNGTLTLPENLTSIGSSVFRDCSFTGRLYIPNGVTTIGNGAFANNDFTSVVIPASVATIDGSAVTPHTFQGNTNLATVYNASALNITVGSTDNGYVGYYAENIITCYTVTFVANNDAYGSVSRSYVIIPSGESLTVQDSAIRGFDQLVVATPTEPDADYNYVFTGWANATGPITSDRTVTANFDRILSTQRIVTFSVPSGYGHWTQSAVVVERGTEVIVDTEQMSITLGEVTVRFILPVDTPNRTYTLESITGVPIAVTSDTNIVAHVSRHTEIPAYNIIQPEKGDVYSDVKDGPEWSLVLVIPILVIVGLIITALRFIPKRDDGYNDF